MPLTKNKRPARFKRVMVKGSHPSRYLAIWRIIDGAVYDALSKHPDYLTEKGERDARRSIVKRVTGSIYNSFAELYGVGIEANRKGPASD